MSNKPEPLTEADSSFTNKQSAETVGSSPHTFPHINSLLSGVPSHTAQVFPQLVTYKIWLSFNSCAGGGSVLTFEMFLLARAFPA